MRPKGLHELSQRLTHRLEDAMAHDEEDRMPVYFCHPIELLESRGSDSAPAGVLYLYRISPDSSLGDAPMRLEAPPVPGAPGFLRRSELWLRMRFVFLVVGGEQSLELECIGAVLRDLHERPVSLTEPFRSASARPEHFETEDDLDDSEEFARSEESALTHCGDVLPIHILDEPNAWKEIGLDEHRLAVTFEVPVSLPSERADRIEPVLERDVAFGFGRES
ncbi:MAG: Pvc16 family protein [Planctomycetota bacterium]